MSTKLDTLESALRAALGERMVSLTRALGEITVVVKAADYWDACTELRDNAALKFSQLIDLCGLDYSNYGEGAWDGARYAVVSHLLSVEHNWRVRVRVFCPEDDMPVVRSLTDVWVAAGWYEREAFDLLGIVFEGHNDLRRILTDYGFVGHPFRKDFPVSGYVEMRYDPEQKRVVYQPVSIEPREITPRVIREDAYGGLGAKIPASLPAVPAAPK
jgi:NADH-quinone oxidoreductase subunit C